MDLLFSLGEGLQGELVGMVTDSMDSELEAVVGTPLDQFAQRLGLVCEHTVVVSRAGVRFVAKCSLRTKRAVSDDLEWSDFDKTVGLGNVIARFPSSFNGVGQVLSVHANMNSERPKSLFVSPLPVGDVELPFEINDLGNTESAMWN